MNKGKTYFIPKVLMLKGMSNTAGFLFSWGGKLKITKDFDQRFFFLKWWEVIKSSKLTMSDFQILKGY